MNVQPGLQSEPDSRMLSIISMQELIELERKLIPLLNKVRELLGKRPIIVPKE